jgi:hypothetical protein
VHCLGGSVTPNGMQMTNKGLSKIAYACEHWIDHLCESALTFPESPENVLLDQGAIHVFLQKQFLHWLEALSFCKSVSKGVIAIDKLSTLFQVYI